MRAAALFVLLSAAVALVSGADNALLLSNKGTSILQVVVVTGGAGMPVSKDVAAGASETFTVPKRGSHVTTRVTIKDSHALFQLSSPRPFKSCLKAADTDKLEKISLVSPYKRSFTVVQREKYSAEVVALPKKDDSGNYSPLLLDGPGTVIYILPNAGEATARVSYSASKQGGKPTELFKVAVQGHECYELRGTARKPEYAKVDCMSIYSNVATCQMD